MCTPISDLIKCTYPWILKIISTLFPTCDEFDLAQTSVEALQHIRMVPLICLTLCCMVLISSATRTLTSSNEVEVIERAVNVHAAKDAPLQVPGKIATPTPVKRMLTHDHHSSFDPQRSCLESLHLHDLSCALVYLIWWETDRVFELDSASVYTLLYVEQTLVRPSLCNIIYDASYGLLHNQRLVRWLTTTDECEQSSDPLRSTSVFASKAVTCAHRTSQPTASWFFFHSVPSYTWCRGCCSISSGHGWCFDIRLVVDWHACKMNGWCLTYLS